MNNTHDDRHFHLVRVCENEPVVRPVPVWIYTEWVHLASGFCDNESLFVGELPTGFPNVEGFGEDVIVHESGEDGEETHENDNVSTASGQLAA